MSLWMQASNVRMTTNDDLLESYRSIEKVQPETGMWCAWQVETTTQTITIHKKELGSWEKHLANIVMGSNIDRYC